MGYFEQTVKTTVIEASEMNNIDPSKIEIPPWYQLLR